MHPKDFLQFEQKAMNAAAFVDSAREMAATLEDREVSAGSRLLARERVARLAGIPSSLLHSLRYRPPKQIAADVYARLCAAVERQAALQIGQLENEILAARARRSGADDSSLCEVESALAIARALMARKE
jgi:hypothetical protein